MLNDASLMERVREGDQDAFREIVDRYKDRLVNYLTRMVRSRDSAEEIAQDAFVRLYHSASNYKHQERLGPYLYRIATNLVISAARRERRWRELLPSLTANFTRSSPSPDAALLSNEIQAQVSEALSALPIKYRAPLVLFEIEEWSYEEIGCALELPAGTVKSRIFRARDLLRRELAPWWAGGGNHDERPADQRIATRAGARESVARIYP